MINSSDIKTGDLVWFDGAVASGSISAKVKVVNVDPRGATIELLAPVKTKRGTLKKGHQILVSFQDLHHAS